MDHKIQFAQVPEILDEGSMESNDEAASSKFEELESYYSPAMMNEIVLDRIFGFLPLKDIKNCRRVCFRWHEVLKPVFRKTTYVTLTLNGNKSLTEFKKVFSKELPFENSKIQSSLLPCLGLGPILWEVSQLEEVFDHWGNKIKHLELEIALNESLSRPFEMRPLTLCSLTGLMLICEDIKNSIKVSLEHLKNIKIIRLIENIVLDIGVEGLKIAPKEIELVGIKFESNEKRLDKIFLNKFIDFRKTKLVRVCNTEQGTAQKVFLDMTQSITVDLLDLHQVEVLEISEAKWTVNEYVILNNINWTQRNQMKFKSLNFSGGDIDIFKLPSTIERLVLTASLTMMENELRILPIGQTNLNNLKYLALDDRSPRDGVFLPLFRNCTKLEAVNLILTHRSVPLPVLKIQTVPSTVTRMEIVGQHIVGGQGFHGLETLILSHCPITQNLLVEIVQKFMPKKIVVDTSCWPVLRHSCFRKCMKLISYFQRQNEVDFWLGPLTVYGSRKQYYFKDHVAGHRGCRKPKVISELEFQEVRRLSVLEDSFDN